jgi:hypothetical protein
MSTGTLVAVGIPCRGDDLCIGFAVVQDGQMKTNRTASS